MWKKESKQVVHLITEDLNPSNFFLALFNKLHYFEKSFKLFWRCELFNNILQAAFLYFADFMYLQFAFANFWCKEIDFQLKTWKQIYSMSW